MDCIRIGWSGRIGAERSWAKHSWLDASTSLRKWGSLVYSCDAVSDLMHNWVPQRPDFKSALRVVKMVLNTQCYQYLWLSMWFHAKKSKETLKKSKSLILQCYFGSRAQKLPKIAKKTDHSIAIYSIFCIGMVYFGCLLVSPHIQAVQNMCSKGG